MIKFILLQTLASNLTLVTSRVNNFIGTAVTTSNSNFMRDRV